MTDSEQVTVVSYSLWQSRLHGDARVLGTKILLDRKPYNVIGVMPRNFEFPLVPGHLNSSELWVPMSFTDTGTHDRSGIHWNFNMVGRLKPGLTPAQAQSDAERVAQETMRNYPAVHDEHAHSAQWCARCMKQTVEQARQLVRTLFLAIVGCVADRLRQSRRTAAGPRHPSPARDRGPAGAGSARLVRCCAKALLESLVLSVTGGVLGLGLAAIALRVGVSRLPETPAAYSRRSALTGRWCCSRSCSRVLTGIVCGLAPAFAALRTSVNEALKEGGRTGTAGGGHAWPALRAGGR